MCFACQSSFEVASKMADALKALMNDAASRLGWHSEALCTFPLACDIASGAEEVFEGIKKYVNPALAIPLEFIEQMLFGALSGLFDTFRSYLSSWLFGFCVLGS